MTNTKYISPTTPGQDRSVNIQNMVSASAETTTENFTVIPVPDDALQSVRDAITAAMQLSDADWPANKSISMHFTYKLVPDFTIEIKKI